MHKIKLDIKIFILMALSLFVAGGVVAQNVSSSEGAGITYLVDDVPPPHGEYYVDPCSLAYIDCNAYTIKNNQTVYGYTSREEETDSTPCITASGYNLCDYPNTYRTVANNCLPFGTVVVIDDIEYVVEDRMNSRYGCDVWDIWYPTYQEAITKGKRTLDVTIVP